MNNIYNRDTYRRVTGYVIEKMEQGEIVWCKSWNPIGLPKNIITQHTYKGWNVFLLNFITSIEGYKTPYFISYKQALERGGIIGRGEKGYAVVWWATVENKNRPLGDGDGEDRFATFRIPKVHTVFNIDQTLGIEFPKVEKLFRSQTFKIAACEKILAAMPDLPSIRHGGDRACYDPRMDMISIPKIESFHSDEAYYKTLFHELAHSTGHLKRLNRMELVTYGGFGSGNYSKEELTAELTAAFLSAVCGIEAQTISNSTAYLQGWLKTLRNDKKMLLHAAAQAQAACDYILGMNGSHVLTKEENCEPFPAIA